MIKLYDESSSYTTHNFKHYEDAEEFCNANGINVSWIDSTDDGFEVSTPKSEDSKPSYPQDNYIIKGTKYLVSDTKICIKSGNTYIMEYESKGNPPSIFNSIKDAYSVINKILNKKYRKDNFKWVVEKLL